MWPFRSDPPPKQPTAALRDWFRADKSESPVEPVPEDDLRDLLYFWFLLDCCVCGRVERFDEQRGQVDDDQPDWPWEFANLAVVPARAAGWTAGRDEGGFPQAYCPECSAKIK